MHQVLGEPQDADPRGRALCQARLYLEQIRSRVSTSRQDVKPAMAKRDYLVDAAKQIRMALDREISEDYEAAFNYYKNGVDLLLKGVQVDPNKERREAVKRKTTQYLKRAEEIFNSHLQGSLGSADSKSRCQGFSSLRFRPIRILSSPVEDLKMYKVTGVIDKVLMVQNPTTKEIFVVKQTNIPLDRVQIEELIHRLDKDRTGMVDYRGLADTRKQMMRDQRRQLRKQESRQKKEKQKSDRVLQTFQSALEEVTPRNSMVISPGLPGDSSSSQHFSATPLSSWHHVVMSNSSRYSVPNMSTEHVHLPPIGIQPRPGSSLKVRSSSQPNLHPEVRATSRTKPISALEFQTNSQPEITSSHPVSPASNSLTRSRPALTARKHQTSTKASNHKSKTAKGKS